MGCGLSSAKAAYPREVRHLNIRGLPDRFAAPSDEPPPPATQAEKAQPSDEPNRSRLSTVFQEGESESIDEEPVAGAPVPASAVALTQLPLAAVGSVTMVGYDPERSKINQDDFAADACFADDPTKAVFAVCDGHGPNGRRVANLLASQLVSTLASELDDDITVDRVSPHAHAHAYARARARAHATCIARPATSPSIRRALASRLPPAASRLPLACRLLPLNPCTARRLVPHTWFRLVPLTTHLSPTGSRLSPPTSRLPPLVSHLTPRASHLTPHTSRLTPHASHLTPHTSRLMRAAVSHLRCLNAPSSS